jgi:vacuolar-type H+-ATPase subunit I/STV1
MLAENEPLFSPRPFWFASPELLIQVRHVEIDALAQLLAKHPDLRNLFDSTDATVSQRSACFELLARVELVQTIDETFIACYEPSPSLSDAEADTLRRTHNLVAADAPAWVSEMQQVVRHLPAHLNASLPEPLRAGGYRHDNPQQNRLIESAVEAFSSFEQIQALIERVLDQQLQRLVRRWSATIVQIPEQQIREHKKRKVRRTRDKLRTRRDRLIAEIDDISTTIGEFLQLMDERRVPPQPTWSGWPGSWREAYTNPRLRKLIHQDKSRALARVRTERNR